MIITTPDILSRRNLFCCRKPPKKVAEAPSVTKRKENPSTKNILGINTFFSVLEAFFSVSSSNDNLVTSDMYPGINGKTHGEMNDTTPAKKANTQLTCTSAPLN